MKKVIQASDTDSYITNMRSNETFKKMEDICKANGYELEEAAISSYGILRLDIRSTNLLSPNIKYWKDSKVFILEVAQSEFTAEEAQEQVNLMLAGYLCISELAKIDLNTLYKEVEQEQL